MNQNLIISSNENSDILINSSYHERLMTYYYISDLHLDWRIDKYIGKTPWRVIIERAVKQIKKTYRETGKYGYILIGGDVTNDYAQLEYFFEKLAEPIREHVYESYSYRSLAKQTIFIIGNHELWSDGEKCLTIVNRIKRLAKKYGIIVLHNEVMLFRRAYDLVLEDPETINNLSYKNMASFIRRRREVYNKPLIISANQLIRKSNEDIKALAVSYPEIVLAGTGFSGYNTEFNAESGIYRGTIASIQEDRKQSNAFSSIYKKMLKSIPDAHVICFTHNPMSDWLAKEEYSPNWIYIHGHTHKNRYECNENRVILSDNQVGYHSAACYLKHITKGSSANPFRFYKNGIYVISRKDYRVFYWYAFSMRISCYREYLEDIIMLKKNDLYMFLARNNKNNRLYLLDGGNISRINGDLEYYYDHMEDYNKAISMSLGGIQDALNSISRAVRKIGGDGRIHGFIVDIDFSNHVYLNPNDGKLTAYSASDMVNKYVYPDIEHLLKDQLPELYKKLINTNSVLLRTDSIPIESPTLETDTLMYRGSREMIKYQYLLNYKVIRNWNEMALCNYNDMMSEINQVESGFLISN